MTFAGCNEEKENQKPLPSAPMTAGKETYAGLFLTALATLMYELLLTRIFSVTMWYHFAFMVISIAIFGLTAGALAVYLLPAIFTARATRQILVVSAMAFAIGTLLSFLCHLQFEFPQQISFKSLLNLVATYVLIGIPFIFSGICVCLVLTRFPSQVSKLYGSDLSGAAVGCLILPFILYFVDGPTAVIVVSVTASLAALCFALEYRQLLCAASICTLLMAAAVPLNESQHFLRLRWVKGVLESRPLYEKWNSFSRIRVYGDPNRAQRPFGWALSSACPSKLAVRQLILDIDAFASTVLTKGGPNIQLEHLKYDITNIAHYIRPASNVLVVGVGGGRDVLSALTFGQKSIVGVEINDNILDVLNNKFGDFTGHIADNPKVSFINDEARSYLTRCKSKFDIIEISMIDTYAASSAGAFVLTENSLYTLEAWKILLAHLSDNGVLSCSRWYFLDRPGEIYRLVSLATRALKDAGFKDPQKHMLLVRNIPPGTVDGVGTLLVGKSEFTDQDVARITEVAHDLNFTVQVTPKTCSDQQMAKILSPDECAAFVSNYPINISPPTDDSPFFFQMARLSQWANLSLMQQGQQSQANMVAIFTLVVLLATVLILTSLCLIVPLALTFKKANLSGAAPFFIYFSSIGMGFLLIEISQIQRLTVFLGHPTYGLCVVLFTLLLASGLGSALTCKLGGENLAASCRRWHLALLTTLLIFGFVSPLSVNLFQAAPTPLRIGIAALLICPLGIVLGSAFPIGMKLSFARYAQLTPWFWCLNGATSVCASVLAVVIAIGAGISATYWSGFAFYVAAFVCCLLMGDRQGAQESQ